MARGRRPGLATASIVTLQKAIERRQREVRNLEKRREALHEQLAKVEAELARILGTATKSAHPVGQPRGIYSTLSLKAAMAEALKASPEPMQAVDVVKAITDGGYTSKAKRFRQIVHSTLTIHPNAKRVGRGLYTYCETGAKPKKKAGRPRKAKKAAAE